MRSVNMEANTAAQFKESGFDVEIFQATYVKGQDFDFKATRDRQTLFVEVTGCTNDRFSVSNIQNVLNAKRKQLPADGPGLLFCIIPQDWVVHYSDLKFGLQYATLDYFGKWKAGRLNAVVYVMSQIKTVGTGAAFVEVSNPVFNPSPRTQTDLSFLIGDKSPEFRPLQRKIWNAPTDTQFDAKLDTISYWRLISSPDSYPRLPKD